MQSLRQQNLKRTAMMVLLALTCTSCAGPAATTKSWPDGSRVTDFAVPGKNYRLQMPPQHMRDGIARLMQAGRAPHFLRLHPRQLRQRCPGAVDVLGCTRSMRNLKVVYVNSLLQGEELRMVLEHEFAHYLYDWKH